MEEIMKEKLKEQWVHACECYLRELLRMWELDSYYGYWIGEEVGGVYDYGGAFTIGMDDIIYCVENDVTEQQCMEWQEYCVNASVFGFVTPNLKSWMMGCPRTSEATFKHLWELKSGLDNEVEAEKERIKKEDTDLTD